MMNTTDKASIMKLSNERKGGDCSLTNSLRVELESVPPHVEFGGKYVWVKWGTLTVLSMEDLFSFEQLKEFFLFWESLGHIWLGEKQDTTRNVSMWVMR